jgi:predicted DsbA family dithiol-disulfide isomerase
MGNPLRVAMYADLACPFAYLIAYRLRLLRSELGDRVVVEHMSLSLEYVNREPTPKPVLDMELPLLFATVPEIPYRPWHRPASEWPVTVWPAFEAVKCAERQSLRLADDLDWAIRQAFFADSRCISLRHVLFDLAESVGLAMDRFAADFDGGVCKHLVLEEARHGWEVLKVDGSPTFVLPTGRHLGPPGLPELDLDADEHHRPTRFRSASCAGEECVSQLRELLENAISARADP